VIKLLGGGKKKPEDTKKSPGKGVVPIDKVKDMSNKGFSEPEIIDSLRKEGYNAGEIDSALTQSLKMGVTGQNSFGSGGGFPTLQDLQGQMQEQPQSPPMPAAPEQQPQPQPPTQQGFAQPQAYSDYYPSDYSTEELVESIVHEKMDVFDKKMIEFKARYGEMERRMSNLHNQLSIMAKSRTDSEEKILSKLDAFKDELGDINAKMSSLERAFKEALPALIESVRSLTDLVQKIKRETA
jgi:hypothetical protein